MTNKNKMCKLIDLFHNKKAHVPENNQISEMSFQFPQSTPTPTPFPVQSPSYALSAKDLAHCRRQRQRCRRRQQSKDVEPVPINHDGANGWKVIRTTKKSPQFLPSLFRKKSNVYYFVRRSETVMA